VREDDRDPNATPAGWEVGERREVVGGERLVGRPPSLAHQRVTIELTCQLDHHLRALRLGRLFAATRLELEAGSIVQPDLMALLGDDSGRSGRDAVVGPPELVTEVLSADSAPYDQGPKLRLYDRCGVREYWLVDPLRYEIDVWVRLRGGLALGSRLRRGEILRSPLLPGLEISLREVFAGR